MARRCKTTEFADLVTEARRSIPGFNVTTDIIVGFPGETDDEWQQSLAYLSTIGFGHIHIFTYSAREGTKAARLPDPIAEAVKKQRSQILHSLADNLKRSWLQQQLGQCVPVLWEYARQETAGQKLYTGYTPNYCKVLVSVPDNQTLENTITATRLNAVADDGSVLYGSLEP
jgi:threonylcarbamoyladenosine tRNA methylthiotransferase MtaB